ncbi:uncharacterized protein LOC126792059 [Argentina anserina]|uniref:uncharacterized protein LOC126792059 n=1 Tax=Argentina anserina TaxID=57926 RepID=UPI0021768495|nr:uncharacterized protein LOC126792059 [Potentilla anserina]
MEKEGRKNAATTNGGDHGLNDPVAKAVIQESIISDSSRDKGHDQKGGAQHPDDVLAFSRCVHKIDSSLE